MTKHIFSDSYQARNPDGTFYTRVHCNSCQALSINGTPCHETGCPDAWRDGTMQIAYYLEYAPPKGSVCKYLCNYPELAERDGLLAIPVVGGGMVSKFAFFTK